MEGSTIKPRVNSCYLIFQHLWPNCRQKNPKSFKALFLNSLGNYGDDVEILQNFMKIKRNLLVRWNKSLFGADILSAR